MINNDIIVCSYNNVRSRTNNLIIPLSPEDCQVQPIEDCSPTKWHLAHTTWFFETFILKHYLKNYKMFNEHFPFLFNSYYNNEGERQPRAKRGDVTRPSLSEILDYRAYIDNHIEPLLYRAGNDNKLAELIDLGLNHEQQHQELLITDIKYVLGFNPLKPAYHNKYLQKDSPMAEAKWLEVPEGLYDIGFSGSGFCFDNEKAPHKVFLPAFSVQNKLVTNEEYIEFIESGAYKNFNYWLSDAWYWLAENNIEAPLYWQKIEGQWHSYTMSGIKKLDPTAPVTHISYYEAEAYATWRGLEILNEFEWEAAAKIYGSLNEESNLMDSGIFAPLPAAKDNNQFFGDCWEWTSSAYLPYPHYKKAKGALGEYNGKFMINQMTLRGGSCATPSSHIRHTYRNFFQPDKRWQFTGIRLAKYD